jgi:hypothetical protein
MTNQALLVVEERHKRRANYRSATHESQAFLKMVQELVEVSDPKPIFSGVPRKWPVHGGII